MARDRARLRRYHAATDARSMASAWWAPTEPVSPADDPSADVRCSLGSMSTSLPSGRLLLPAPRCWRTPGGLSGAARRALALQARPQAGHQIHHVSGLL